MAKQNIIDSPRWLAGNASNGRTANQQQPAPTCRSLFPMFHRDEKALNSILGTVLQEFHPRTEVLVERSKVLDEGGQPDLVVHSPGRERVLIENKYDTTTNANRLENQCQARLGRTWSNSKGAVVRVAVAVLSPREELDRISDAELPCALHTGWVTFRWAVWTGTEHDAVRLPTAGWMDGSVQELAACIDRVGAEAGADANRVARLQEDLATAARIIGAPNKYREILKQEPGEQTSRMAMAVLFNAALCQATIASHYGTIRSPSQMMAEGCVYQSDVLLEWRSILEISYWPIFGVAWELLYAIPDMVAAQRMLEWLFAAVNRIADDPDAHSLVGRIFGELIADRKFLATYYTRPAPAAMLAEMAVARLPMHDWKDPNAIGNLRIADLACGTGSLLVAVYRRIAERHNLAGGDARFLHLSLIEDVLIGCDVMPAAVHLTAARLSGEQPDIDYTGTKTYVLPFGDTALDGDSRYCIGSLDLLHRSHQPALFGDGTIAATSTGEDVNVFADVPAESLDMVIMNPPFTRSTGHEGQAIGVPRPIWAGFGQSPQQQQAMQEELKRQVGRIKGLKAAHGNAGLATNFIDLAHAKLKDGGVLALIVPASVVSGSAWANTRRLLVSGYRDISICTLAEHGSGGTEGRAFSADTGMAEAVVLATRDDSNHEESKARYFLLNDRPDYEYEAVELALTMSTSEPDRRFRLGDASVGWAFDLPFAAAGDGHPSGVRFPAVIRAVRHLQGGRLSLVRMRQEFDLPMTRLSKLGVRGPYHMDLDGMANDAPRGPFDVRKLSDRSQFAACDYPCLWSHEHAAETRVQVLPDADAEVWPGMEDMAFDRWEGYVSAGNQRIAGATRLHINRDFQVNSQALGACLTQEKSLGGHAWPSFQPMPDGDDSVQWEHALAIWMNTLPGITARWWVSNRQQRGRARLSITTIGGIPVLDLRAIEPAKVKELADLCTKYLDVELLPANEAYRDESRKRLDEDVLCGVLGLPNAILEPLEHFRLQWCSEPSVHGGKGTRPSLAQVSGS